MAAGAHGTQGASDNRAAAPSRSRSRRPPPRSRLLVGDRRPGRASGPHQGPDRRPAAGSWGRPGRRPHDDPARHLELDRLVCSGRPLGDEHTYALFADRVPNSGRSDRDEALGELALRYFTGHGPATERDLAYWATLTVTDVRKGLDLAGDRLASFEHEGRTFWHAPGDPPRRRGEPVGHLLQILDETYRGFQETRWVLDTADIVPRARESSTGMALVDAQLLAAMRRTVTTDRVAFELAPYRDLRSTEITALRRAAERYGEYLDLDPALELP